MALRLNRSGAALTAALERNDFSVIADMLRSGERLGDELRAIIADKIEGKLKGKRGPSSRTDIEKIISAKLCCDWLTNYEGFDKDAAVVQTAEFFGVTDRTIYEWLAAKPEKSAIQLLAATFFADLATGRLGRIFAREEVLWLMPFKVKRFLEK